LARGIEQAEPFASAPDRSPAIQMPPHEHLEAGAGAAPGLLRELEHDALERHRVVWGDHPRVLVAEDLVEIEIAEPHPRGIGVPGRVAEGGVVLRDEHVRR